MDNYEELNVTHNDDGTYTVIIDGKEYVFQDSIDLAHFLEDIGA